MNNRPPSDDPLAIQQLWQSHNDTENRLSVLEDVATIEFIKDIFSVAAPLTYDQQVAQFGLSYDNRNLKVGAKGLTTVQNIGVGAIPLFSRIRVGDGTAALPSYSFINDIDTGFYRPSANTIGVSLAGALDFSFSANSFNVLSGSVITIADMTQGSVLFAGASGVVSQDNSNFFWDDSSNRLGIGTATPSTNLHLYENNTDTSPAFLIEQDLTGDAAIAFLLTADIQWTAGIDNSDSNIFKIQPEAALTNNLDGFLLQNQGAICTAGINAVSIRTFSVYSNGASSFHFINAVTGSAGTDGAYFQLTGDDFAVVNQEVGGYLQFAVDNGANCELELLGRYTRIFKSAAGDAGLGINIAPTASDQLRLSSASTTIMRIVNTTHTDGLRIDFTAGAVANIMNEKNQSGANIVFHTRNPAWRTITMSAGGLTIDTDSAYIKWGGGQDCGIMYNGTNMIFDSQLVGSTADFIFENGDLIVDDGEIGIGTTNPDGFLHIMSADQSIAIDGGADDFIIEGGAGKGMTIIAEGGNANIHFGDAASSTIGRIVYSNTDNSLQFWTNALERVSVESTGIVFIEETLKIKERAAAAADTVAYGQLWIKNTTPCQLWFTDDAGTDTQIV